MVKFSRTLTVLTVQKQMALVMSLHMQRLITVVKFSHFLVKYLPSVTKLWRLCFYRGLSVHRGGCSGGSSDTSMHWGTSPGRYGNWYEWYTCYWTALLFNFLFILILNRCARPNDESQWTFRISGTFGNDVVLCSHHRARVIRSHISILLTFHQAVTCINTKYLFCKTFDLFVKIKGIHLHFPWC